MRFYHFIVGTVALGLAGCAAYFSVIGIATFFGTNFTQTAIAAGFLEAGKLVCASAAYRYRNVIQGWTNKFLVFFTAVMMFITSLGIFGFLSQSYQTASAQQQISEQEVENVRSEMQTFEKRIQRLEADRDRLVDTRNNLRELQAEQGWLSERDAERLQQIPQDLGEIDSRITEARDQILKLEKKITALEAENSKSAKLGPIMFVADAVGLDPDRAALYFILTIIFVFDPMAVTLVVSLSMATDIDEADAGDEEQQHEEEVTSNDDSPSPMDVAEEVGKSLPDDDNEEQETMEAGDIGSLYDFGEEKTVSAGTPHLPLNHISSLYESEDEQQSSEDHEEDFREEGIDELVEEENDEEDEFEEWLEGSDEENDGPQFPNVTSAFKKPFNNLS